MPETALTFVRSTPFVSWPAVSYRAFLLLGQDVLSPSPCPFRIHPLCPRASCLLSSGCCRGKSLCVGLARQGFKLGFDTYCSVCLTSVEDNNHVGLTGLFEEQMRAYSSEDKITVHFINRDGETLTSKGKVGDTLLDVVVENNLDIDGFGACEGTLACSTCHLIFEQHIFEKLEAISDEENDMLDLAYGLTDRSRLGCQICLTKAMDNMTVRVPDAVSDARESIDTGMNSSKLELIGIFSQHFTYFYNNFLM
ncbi:adrenodoxin, mitochondrial isoform X1 [Physeter macrocephalus]|uniref:Adrenal ferredoxin n=1 Tax=Physeter macrocephalus TaxID=9755 RepID=A0A455C775_PHYMC|nr:adrenodoxin, mitochondrial isoform X1 [Physeter catodon]|eukprot:XP_028357190.1 adrenodoxin, mitochondrial isoform X1 [Physeter catodon]